MTHPTDPVAAMREAKFKVGDLVERPSSYRYPGIVRSVYPKGDGELRYDVEADHPDFAGMLHIFSEAQLIPRRPVAPRELSTDPVIAMHGACAKVAEDLTDALPYGPPEDGNHFRVWHGRKIAAAIRALPLPAAQPDPRDEALRLAREALVAVRQRTEDVARGGGVYAQIHLQKLDAALAAIDALKE